MMEITVKRILDKKNSTLGILTIKGEEYFTLEDPYREEKVADLTRVPAGRYEIKLRNAGTMNKRYTRRYDYHEGMLWLQDVPDFKWVYIHIGNKHQDTSGCILVGEKASMGNDESTIQYSAAAYKDIYLYCTDAFQRGEKIFIYLE